MHNLIFQWLKVVFLVSVLYYFIMYTEEDEQRNYRERTLSLADNFTKKAVERQMRNNMHSVQALKNRLKVLSSQADYNRFRSRYQAQKIEKHQKIHQSALHEKKQIEERLKTFMDNSNKKQNREKIKQETKQKLMEAYEKMKIERAEVRNQIEKRTERNIEIIAKRRTRDFQKRKNKKDQVTKMENSIRDSLARYNQEKLDDLRAIKECEKRNLMNYSQQMAKQLQTLSKREKELIEINSESMKSSRLIGLQFNKLYPSRSKDHVLLPEIKCKSPAHTHSTTSQFQ